MSGACLGVEARRRAFRKARPVPEQRRESHFVFRQTWQYFLGARGGKRVEAPILMLDRRVESFVCFCKRDGIE